MRDIIFYDFTEFFSMREKRKGAGMYLQVDITMIRKRARYILTLLRRQGGSDTLGSVGGWIVLRFTRQDNRFVL